MESGRICECGHATGMQCEEQAERFVELDWVPVHERRERRARGVQPFGNGTKLRVSARCADFIFSVLAEEKE